MRLRPELRDAAGLPGLQGLGFGGEWAVGAILVAEYAAAKYRGRALGVIQSSWAVGWALAVIVYTLSSSTLDEDIAWRVLFWTGALPALLHPLRAAERQDAPQATEQRRRSKRRGLRFIDLHAAACGARRSSRLLSTGVQGGYYTLRHLAARYLKTRARTDGRRHWRIPVVLICGAFFGYITARSPRRPAGPQDAFALFAFLSAGLLMTYVNIPQGSNSLLLILGFPLGFSASAIFSGFGSYLAELYPGAVRGTGQSFSYNVGRALGAIFPTAVGFSSAGCRRRARLRRHRIRARARRPSGPPRNPGHRTHLIAPAALRTDCVGGAQRRALSLSAPTQQNDTNQWTGSHEAATFLSQDC